MEIVIVVLLLIGALTLGSNAPTSGKVAGNGHLEAQAEQTLTEQVDDVSQRLCRYADGPLTQRDLTVPRASAVPHLSNTIEQPGHACSDE